MYRIVSTTGAYSASGTLSANRDWAAAISTYYQPFETTKTGGMYNLASNSWSTTKTNLINGTGGPTARSNHTAVWTGSKMIVWGGIDDGPAGSCESGESSCNVTPDQGGSGSLYDPTTDTWTAMSTTNAPLARHNTSSVWTGQYFMLWGGMYKPTTSTRGYYSTGGYYAP
jgi:hypothetical protein